MAHSLNIELVHALSCPECILGQQDDLRIGKALNVIVAELTRLGVTADIIADELTAVVEPAGAAVLHFGQLAREYYELNVVFLILFQDLLIGLKRGDMQLLDQHFEQV